MYIFLFRHFTISDPDKNFEDQCGIRDSYSIKRGLSKLRNHAALVAVPNESF